MTIHDVSYHRGWDLSPLFRLASSHGSLHGARLNRKRGCCQMLSACQLLLVDLVAMSVIQLACQLACATWIHMNPHDHTWSTCHICHEKALATTHPVGPVGPVGPVRFAGLVPSPPSEPGRDDTERFEPRNCARRPCTALCDVFDRRNMKKSPRRRLGVRSMNGDPYVWSSGGSGGSGLFRFIQVRGAVRILTEWPTSLGRHSVWRWLRGKHPEDVETSNLGSRWSSAEKDLMIQSPEAFP